VNNVSNGGDIVGRVSGTGACDLILHAIFMFIGHVGCEERVVFCSFSSPDLQGIVEESCFVHIVVAKAK